MGAEKEIETSIIEYIRAIGGWCQKIQSGEAYKIYRDKKYRIKLADAGTPDILACIEGTFFGIEVKKAQKQVDDLLKEKTQTAQDQMYQLKLIDQADGQAMIVDSLDGFIRLYEDYKATLQD